MQDYIGELTDLCRAKLGEGTVTELTRLSGGASMESWRFSFGERALVLRRLPFQAEPAVAADNDVGAISLETQAGLIAYLHGVGLCVPEVIAQLPPNGPMGEGFIMACVEGEALPARLLNKPEYETARERLSAQCAAERRTSTGATVVSITVTRTRRVGGA